MVSIKSKLEKFGKKTLKYKKTLKKSKSTLVIPSEKVESIWNDTNRFFKGEMEEAKKAMFFE